MVGEGHHRDAWAQGSSWVSSSHLLVITTASMSPADDISYWFEKALSVRVSLNLDGDSLRDASDPGTTRLESGDVKRLHQLTHISTSPFRTVRSIASVTVVVN